MAEKSLKVVIVGELDQNGVHRPNVQNSFIMPYFDNNFDSFMNYVEKRFDWLESLRQNLQFYWIDDAEDSIIVSNQKDWRLFKIIKQQTPVTKTPTIYITTMNYSQKQQNGARKSAILATIATQTEDMSTAGQHMSDLEAAAKAFEAGAKASAEAAKMAETNARAAQEAAKAAKEAAKAVELAIVACKSA